MFSMRSFGSHNDASTPKVPEHPRCPHTSGACTPQVPVAELPGHLVPAPQVPAHLRCLHLRCLHPRCLWWSYLDIRCKLWACFGPALDQYIRREHPHSTEHSLTKHQTSNNYPNPQLKDNKGTNTPITASLFNPALLGPQYRTCVFCAPFGPQSPGQGR